MAPANYCPPYPSLHLSVASYVFTPLRDGIGYPSLDREGTVYGQSSTSPSLLHFAGGVNTRAPSTTAFVDIYTYDMSEQHPLSTLSPTLICYTDTPCAGSNVFTKAQLKLPHPSYFGTGGVFQSKLCMYSGRTNNGSFGVQNTYFADMQVVDFTASLGITLIPPSPQHKSHYIQIVDTRSESECDHVDLDSCGHTATLRIELHDQQWGAVRVRREDW